MIHNDSAHLIKITPICVDNLPLLIQAWLFHYVKMVADALKWKLFVADALTKAVLAFQIEHI